MILWMVAKSYTHWIGFRENLQGSPLFFNGKIYGFLKIVPSTNPLMHKMVATGNYETLWNTVNNVIINLDKPSTSCRISQPSSVSDFGFYGETWGELMGVETWLHGIFSVWLCNTKKTDNLCRQMAHLSVFNLHFMESGNHNFNLSVSFSIWNSHKQSKCLDSVGTCADRCIHLGSCGAAGRPQNWEVGRPKWYQWEFQDPKMEVLTIYKAYLRPMFQGISPENMARNMVRLRTSICWILKISHWWYLQVSSKSLWSCWAQSLQYLRQKIDFIWFYWIRHTLVYAPNLVHLLDCLCKNIIKTYWNKYLPWMTWKSHETPNSGHN